MSSQETREERLKRQADEWAAKVKADAAAGGSPAASVASSSSSATAPASTAKVASDAVPLPPNGDPSARNSLVAAAQRKAEEQVRTLSPGVHINDFGV